MPLAERPSQTTSIEQPPGFIRSPVVAPALLAAGRKEQARASFDALLAHRPARLVSSARF